MKKKTTGLTITAVFAALIFVATVVLPIPIPATGGYVNLGDAIILIAVWSIGGVRGGLSAGIGAGLADLFLAPIYAPGTFVIKFVMALSAYGIYKGAKNIHINKSITWGLSALVSEIIMVLGYLFYEGIVLGLGYGAILGVSGNVLQGIVSIVISLVLIHIFETTKLTQRLMKVA